LIRQEVPDGVSIAPAPAGSPPRPQTPQAAAESILELVRKHRSEDARKIRFRLSSSPPLNTEEPRD
jgi:hypothetical protein